MLLRKDVDRLFQLAQAKGALTCELYGERSQRLTCRFRDRLSHTASERDGGLLLTLQFPFGPRTFFTSHADPEGLAQLLEGQLPEFRFTNRAHSAKEAATDPHTRQTFQNLERSLKRLQLDSSALQDLELHYADDMTEYVFADTDGNFCTGTEQTADIRGQAVFQKEDRRQILESRRAVFDQNLSSDLENEPLFSATRLKVCTLPVWPFPEGALTLHWSSLAVAKLWFWLGRSLEGDLALRQASWISHSKVPPLAFDLYEHFGQESGFDREGTPRGRTLLIERGQIRTVLTDRALAKALGLNSTANARRIGCLLPATVAPCSLGIQAIEVEENLLSKVEAGIAIDDVKVRSFDFRSAEMELELTQSRLIHHGEAGDPLEPLVWRLPLTELLSSFRVFETRTERHGLWLNKQSNRFLVEITTPAAISTGLNVPGKVPPQHYW